MDATLSISCDDMAAQDIQEMTFELMRTLNQETDLTVRIPEESGGGGSKGAGVEIGQILLAALSSGTVVAMFNVLKSYIDRKPSLKLEIEATDGRKLKIDAEHLSKEQLNQTLRMAQSFCNVPA